MPSGKEVMAEQRNMRQLVLELDADGASPVLNVGNPEISSLVRNGAGDYTLTFRKAYARAPIALVTGAEDNAMGSYAASTVSSIQILIEDASTNAAADLDVAIMICGWDATDEA